MPSAKIWEKLESKWTGRIYEQRLKEERRMKHFESHLAPLFKGMSVIDVGCNAGLHAFALQKYVTSYVGIEIDRDYFAQALVTAKYLDERIVSFACTPALPWLLSPTAPYNALLLSAILYHFPDEEVITFRDKILPNVKLAVMHHRYHRPTIKNSYGLHEPGRVMAFFEDAGFQAEQVDGGHPGWFAVVCRRQP